MGQSTSTLQICCAVSPTLKMFCCRFVAPFSNRKTSGNLTFSCIFLDRIMQIVLVLLLPRACRAIFICVNKNLHQLCFFLCWRTEKVLEQYRDHADNASFRRDPCANLFDRFSVISVNLGFHTLKQRFVFARLLHFIIRYCCWVCYDDYANTQKRAAMKQRVLSAYSFIKFQFEHLDLLWDWFVVKSWKKRLQR